jgi:hypothetical protein
MRRFLTVPLASGALVLALLAGCQTSPAAETAQTSQASLASPPTSTRSEAPASVDTHEAMVRWFNPAATAIWDVSNNAMGDTGELDAALMDDGAWQRMAEAARSLEQHSLHMAQARELRVGDHNDALEGFATKAEIQAMIDADPAGFRQLAQDTASHASELAQAAAARDASRAGTLSDGLSERCQACHSRYWEKPA